MGKSLVFEIGDMYQDVDYPEMGILIPVFWNVQLRFGYPYNNDIRKRSYSKPGYWVKI